MTFPAVKSTLVPMRVNIYAEEMTDRVEIITKEIDGNEFTAVRFYLYLPVTMPGGLIDPKPTQFSGPFIHRPGDDDSAAVTFWGKSDLRPMLQKALTLLDGYYYDREQTRQMRENLGRNPLGTLSEGFREDK